MIGSLLHALFSVVKFLFGLGALCGLLALGLLLLWYVLRVLTSFLLRGQPVSRFPYLRKLFLDL